MDGRVERNKDVLKKSKYGCMKWEKLQIGRRKVISNEGFQGCKERRKESLGE